MANGYFRISSDNTTKVHPGRYVITNPGFIKDDYGDETIIKKTILLDLHDFSAVDGNGENEITLGDYTGFIPLDSINWGNITFEIANVTIHFMLQIADLTGLVPGYNGKYMTIAISYES